MKMRLSGAVLAAAASLVLCASPARADYVVKDGNGAFQTMKSFIVSLIHHPAHVIEGLFSGTPTPLNETNTGALDVTCVSGCAGSGSPMQQTGGTVGLVAGSADVGTVHLGAGTQVIGHVIVDSGALAVTVSGVSTATNQSTEIGSLASIVTNTTGGATAANQSTANGSLASIVTNTTGASTASNQTSQITQETAVNTILGTVTASPTANTIADRLKTINATLASPFQAGGSIGNTSFTNPAVGSTGSATPASASLSGADSSGNTVALIQADTSVPINISTAVTTQLVALSSGKKIYVTAWDVISAGAGNLTLEYGTGSLCGTGTTALTGAYNLVATAGIAKGNGLAPVLIVPASNALCAVTSAAVQMSGSLAYTQF